MGARFLQSVEGLGQQMPSNKEGGEHLRPHQGAVKATKTSLSPPTMVLKDSSVSMFTALGGVYFFLGLALVFSVMKLLKLSRSRPPL